MEKLSRVADVSRASLDRIEKGAQDPTTSMLERIAKALGVHLSVFFVQPNPNHPILIDPELQLFFAGPWQKMSERDREWLRSCIPMVREHYERDSPDH